MHEFLIEINGSLTCIALPQVKKRNICTSPPRRSRPRSWSCLQKFESRSNSLKGHIFMSFLSFMALTQYSCRCECENASSSRTSRKVVPIDHATFYIGRAGKRQTRPNGLRSNVLMSYSKSVTSITNMIKFQGIFIRQKMTLHGDDKQRPLTCVAIAAGNKGQGRKVQLATAVGRGRGRERRPRQSGRAITLALARLPHFETCFRNIKICTNQSLQNSKFPSAVSKHKCPMS